MRNRMNKGNRVKDNKAGFTLIELMIVVAIIGILAAVAVPKFANLLNKANEAKTKTSLSAMRTALTIYYASTEGEYPQNSGVGFLPNRQQEFGGVLIPQYLDYLPLCYTPGYHPKVDPVTVDYISSLSFADGSCDGEWVYVSGKTSVDWGRIFVECYDVDLRGIVWSTY